MVGLDLETKTMFEMRRISTSPSPMVAITHSHRSHCACCSAWIERGCSNHPWNHGWYTEQRSKILLILTPIPHRSVTPAAPCPSVFAGCWQQGQWQQYTWCQQTLADISYPESKIRQKHGHNKSCFQVSDIYTANHPWLLDQDIWKQLLTPDLGVPFLYFLAMFCMIYPTKTWVPAQNERKSTGRSHLSFFFFLFFFTNPPLLKKQNTKWQTCAS